MLVEVRQGVYRLSSVPLRPATVFMFAGSTGLALCIVALTVGLWRAFLILLCGYIVCMVGIAYWALQEHRNLPHTILLNAIRKKRMQEK